VNRVFSYETKLEKGGEATKKKPNKPKEYLIQSEGFFPKEYAHNATRVNLYLRGRTESREKKIT